MKKSNSGQPPVREKPGAKGKYERWLTEDGLILLQGWARAGLTDAQIAHNCGINVRTLLDWKTKYDPISHALKEGKQVIDILVENALLKRALGYDYTEEMVEDSDKNGTTTRTTTKHMAPDVIAQIYWLKNRKRDMWKDSHDKVEIERERLALDEKRLDMDRKEASGDSTIHVVLSDEMKELAE